MAADTQLDVAPDFVLSPGNGCVNDINTTPLYFGRLSIISLKFSLHSFEKSDFAAFT